jgi:hypothetical protein
MGLSRPAMELFYFLYVEAATGRPKINAKKKELWMNSKITKDINVSNAVTKTFEEFTYLGSYVTEGGELHDVTARTKKENGTFVEVLPLWRNKNILMDIKIRIFHFKVNSVLLCVCAKIGN